jgi:arylsulfatase A-like enzyme
MNQQTRRDFMKTVAAAAALAGMRRIDRPNILFAIADDWSWPHASIALDPVVRTPVFDRVAREGVLFENAFVSSPSCTPSRGAILTGQYHWRLEAGGNLHSALPSRFDVYPDLLEAAGYHVGCTRKGWGPGNHEKGGWTRNPAGTKVKDFAQFLDKRPGKNPFCFWFGSHDPHRRYRLRSGVESGMRLDDVEVPPCLPDSEEVRSDLCDYYFEVQRFDREVGDLLQLLEERGELDRTLVVITSDNGMPFPRCKSNLYDLGTRVPLAVRWGDRVKGGRRVKDFISLTDVAPTFLEAAGLKPSGDMTGRSFLDILASKAHAPCDRVFFGKERHAWVRKDGLGYPMRAVRTRDHLYIRNYEPDRWPAGDPDERRIYKDGYGDIDASPTKTYMLEHRDDRRFALAFEKRPAEELYDLAKDPAQMNNVAEESEAIRKRLARVLEEMLLATEDPRAMGKGEDFDGYPYFGRIPEKKD